MKKRIKVIYDGMIDEELDAAIKEAMIDVVGAQWYAQGYDIPDNKRDLNFDYEVPDA